MNKIIASFTTDRIDTPMESGILVIAHFDVPPHVPDNHIFAVLPEVEESYLNMFIGQDYNHARSQHTGYCKSAFGSVMCYTVDQGKGYFTDGIARIHPSSDNPYIVGDLI